MPCWFCDVRLVRRNGPAARDRPDHATREHLIPRAAGGDDHPENLRDACGRCNSFVGHWPLEFKLRFRVLMTELGGWRGFERRFGGPSLGRRTSVELVLLDIPPPTDSESERIRAVLGPIVMGVPAVNGSGHGNGHEVNGAAPEPETDAPLRVIVDTAPYLHSGRELRSGSRGPWYFLIGAEVWKAGGKRRAYSAAVGSAVAKAQRLGIDRITLLPKEAGARHAVTASGEPEGEVASTP